MTTLFGFYDLGLSSLRAAQTGLQVTGENIANINTPGFARRRVELAPGFPIQVRGGFLSNGVQVDRVRRQQDGLIQFNLERETGSLASNEERLRGLRGLEESLGTLESDNLSALYSGFSEAFTTLAGSPEDLTLRRGAIAAADRLAGAIRGAWSRLDAQRRQEDQAVRLGLEEVNRLAADLADLNRRIASTEGGGATNAPLRDQRQQVVEQLADLTGGYTVPDERGRLQFALPGGGTLVTSERARPVALTSAADGTAQISLGGNDLTATLRSGRLGALLELRDESIPEQQTNLDNLARDLIRRANPAVLSGQDLQGNPGQALFQPTAVVAPGVAARIEVNPAILGDAATLAISSDGTPGNGDIAATLAGLQTGAGLSFIGGKTPEQFLADASADLGNRIGAADVATGISTGLLEGLAARREQVSGVSLDEEAVELIRFQRSYEAAARFIGVLNEITEVTVNLGR